MGRKKGALLVILAVAVAVIFTVATNIDVWRNRINPSVDNAPANATLPPRAPAPAP